MPPTEALAKHLVVGPHGTTYGGNPLACAVAEAVIDTVNTPEVLEGVNAKHRKFKARLEKIGENYGLFTQVSGLGLLIGCVLNDAWKGKAKDIFNAAEKEGMMLIPAGTEVISCGPCTVGEDASIHTGSDRRDGEATR